MKFIIRLLLAVAMLGAVQSSYVGVATAASTSAEKQFVSLINKERTKRGLAPLTVNRELANVARRWTDTMVSNSQGCPSGLAHNRGYAKQVPGGWSRIGENVGCGSSVTSVHRALMRSKSHRANILGDFNQVGIGVSVDRRGSVWITQNFGNYPRR